MANLSGVFRIGRDAEVRTTSNGEAVCNLSLAYSYGKKGEDGNRPAQWLDVALWGKRATALEQYLVKGQMVYAVINEPHIEEFKKKDGTTGVKMSGSIGEIELIGGGKSDSKPKEAPRKEAQKESKSGSFDDMEDDIPF